MRLLGLILGLAISGGAYAQTAPSPAQMGITPTTTPEVLQTLDSTKTWVPLGTVDSSTHTFTPVGGGTIISGSPVIFPSHTALLSGTTTAIPPQPISQSGFYNSGDGGAAAYNWSASSYCPGGSSSAITPADGIVCVLPIGQSASTAGRYLLQVGATIDVRTVGMQPSTLTNLFDNSPYVAALITAQGPPVAQTFNGVEVVFPPVAGQITTAYYFTQALDWSRNGRITCRRSGSYQSTYLVFAPGADGIIQDTGAMSADGGGADGQDIDGCRIQSNGVAKANDGITTGITNGSTAITGVSNPGGYAPVAPGGPFVVPASAWEVGDGIVAAPGIWYDVPYVGSLLQTPPGTYVTAVGSGTLTTSAPAVFPHTATGYTPFRPIWSSELYRLPVELTYNITVAGPATVAATAAFAGGAKTIAVASCTGVTLNAFVIDLTYSPTSVVGTVGKCNGTTLTLFTTAAFSSSGAADSLQFTSNIVTMTGGPQVILMPGDFLWTDAFPFGAQVAAAYNTVNQAASGAWSNAFSITLSTPCPASTVYPYQSVAISPFALAVDTTTGTVLGEVQACSGSTLYLYSASSGGSGDTIAIPVYSTYPTLATAGGHQTIVVGNRTDIAPSASSTYLVNGAALFATANHTAGSGKMWKLPTGISRRGQAFAHNNVVSGWAFGEKLSGSAGTFPPGGGNNSVNQNNNFSANLIGVLSSGDNSGASTYIADVYGDNHVYDIVEAGTVGSAYFGQNTNSSESGSSPEYGFAMECGSLNESSIYGSYVASGPYGRSCLPTDGTLGAPPPNGSIGTGPLQIAPQQGGMADNNVVGSGHLQGAWSADGNAVWPTPTIASVATPSGTVVAIANPSNWFAGAYVSDANQQAMSATVGAAGSGGGSGTCTFTVNGGYPITPGTTNAKFSATLASGGLSGALTLVSNGNYNQNYLDGPPATPANPAAVTGTGSCSGLTGATVNATWGSAIPAGSTITVSTSSGQGITISNAVVGAGVLVGDPIVASAAPAFHGGGGSCVGISGGFQPKYGLDFQLLCGAGGPEVVFQWNGAYGAWAFGDKLGADAMLIADPAGYHGYNASGQFNAVFPRGALFGTENNNVGDERLICMSATMPAEAWHKKGDLCFNTAAAHGSPMGWVDLSDGANFVPLANIP